jgi:hypothetical protein
VPASKQAAAYPTATEMPLHVSRAEEELASSTQQLTWYLLAARLCKELGGGFLISLENAAAMNTEA